MLPILLGITAKIRPNDTVTYQKNQHITIVQLLAGIVKGIPCTTHGNLFASIECIGLPSRIVCSDTSTACLQNVNSVTFL